MLIIEIARAVFMRFLKRKENMGSANTSKDRTKTKELMVLIARRLENKSNYGVTLFNKALYFIDNIYYLNQGAPISEFTYIKQEFGPTPEPSLFLTLRDELLASEDLTLVQSDYFGRIQKKLIANREPDWELFSKEEIRIIDETLLSIADLNGSQVSDFSHQFPAWKVADDREELPFYTFLLSSKTPTPQDIEWAKSQIKECTE